MATKATDPNSSILGESLTLRGRITGDGNLEVRGRIEGEVDVRGDLTIAEGALVRANLQGARVVIRGAVAGDVVGSEAILLEKSARVIGNLTAPRVAIALGAQVRGDVDMGGEGGVRRPAAARPAAAPVVRPARAPLPPAKSVVVTRKAPVAQAPAVAAPQPAAKKAPPAPVVPAIKKGAKAAPKRKGEAR